MSRFVLDCSVTMAWCFEDESNKYTEGVLDTLLKGEGCVPAVWALEVANVLLVGERRKRLTTAQSLRFANLIRDLPISVDEGTAERAFGEILSLARDHSLSSYDGAYLELAIRKGLPLATQDVPLRRAAKKSGVPLL